MSGRGEPSTEKKVVSGVAGALAAGIVAARCSTLYCCALAAL
jgi:hypothetical protein